MTKSSRMIDSKTSYQIVSSDTTIASIDAFAHACLLMDELEMIAQAAMKRGLQFIPLKGAAVIIGGYNRSFVRSMTDVDLLTKESDYSDWQQLFLENSYTPLPFSLSSFVKTKYPTHAIFDLHTSLRFIPPRLVDMAWEKSKKVNYAEIDYKLLPVETDLLYQCLHMTVTHGYGGEKWMRDLDALIRTHAQTIDWTALVDYAYESFASAPLLATLKHLQKNFSTPIPKTMIVEIEKNSTRISVAVFTYALRCRRGIPFFDYIAPLMLRRSIPEVFIAAWTKLFPPIAAMKQRYNTVSKAAAVVIYPIRVLKLTGKGAFAILNIILTFVISRIHR
jgi:hypothetical protein